MTSGKKSGTPHRGPTTEVSPTLQHDERRKIIRFASDSVACPGTHRRAPRQRVTTILEDLCRRMIEEVGGHRLHDGDLVGDGPEMRQAIRKLGTGLPVSTETESRSHDGCVRLNECVSLPGDHRRRNRLSVELTQFRLVVEQLQLARASCHEQENHPFRLGSKMGVARSEWIVDHAPGQVRQSTRDRRGEADLAKPYTAAFEEVAPCLRL